MPELPEVETIRRQLERAIKGRRIVGLKIRYKRPLKAPEADFRRAILGAKITGVGRRAKLLLWNLSSGFTIMFHLKMTGRILIVKNSVLPTKHTHFVFDLSGNAERSPGHAERGREKIFFEDYRKFGYIKLCRTSELEKFFAEEGYGPEPLDPGFTFKKFALCLRGKPNKKIKPLLMEQTCIAGIGNIYVAEACFAARIMPTRTVKTLRDADIRNLFAAIKKVLRASIKYRGTSADTYLDAYGQKGKFMPRLMVYGRAGERCRRCGGIVKNMRLGGRGTDYCPKCQH